MKITFAKNPEDKKKKGSPNFIQRFFGVPDKLVQRSGGTDSSYTYSNPEVSENLKKLREKLESNQAKGLLLRGPGGQAYSSIRVPKENGEETLYIRSDGDSFRFISPNELPEKEDLNFNDEPFSIIDLGIFGE